ncbi:hypothetical protein [Aneurinibacillus migulanus]|uniref:Uncharacterized protein n=1 Tax=Aneurinibacillus migulanus TaxID=47500 RepID=A0A0D1WBD1_ANEMI|nr:hypothetical protein [Aneurinibacillus migulanus]KIV55865.1 hypothetical protein TS65_14115 [Aneurinibacillus migulanus]KON97737.1 hypothetical protein AF333_22165 [Aneurinibacillus migulanus]MED0895706.1 hypothetical protein [Aneurinibacillus migulanus]MED1619839.1 hypothetical protein [Aneurinibacillus migulanus]
MKTFCELLREVDKENVIKFIVSYNNDAKNNYDEFSSMFDELLTLQPVENKNSTTIKAKFIEQDELVTVHIKI